MPIDHQQQNERRRAIRRLLRSRSIRTQAALADELRELGHTVTQSSISRDLRELQVIKDPEGYRLVHTAEPEPLDAADASLDYIRSAAPAGPNLLVIRTAIGAAQRVAFELDRTEWPEIVGTISGDDTIFVATSGQVATRRLIAKLPLPTEETSQ